MSRKQDSQTIDLFSEMNEVNPKRIELGEEAVILRGYANDIAVELFDDINAIIAISPLRQMQTPNGYTMSVRTSSCGPYGWVSDRHGYRYAPIDPLTNQPWPALPNRFLELAHHAAQTTGFNHFVPDCCLINSYKAGAKLSLHKDKDEHDFTAPIVSISLGLPAIFLFGGLNRSDKTQRYKLEHGDVAVWGGKSRLAYHGILPLIDGNHPLTGHQRINITFRKVM